MAHWLSYLDDDAPVEINITIDNNGYTVRWITGREDPETGDYFHGKRAVGSLQEAIQLATNISTTR